MLGKFGNMWENDGEMWENGKILGEGGKCLIFWRMETVFENSGSGTPHLKIVFSRLVTPLKNATG